MLRLLPALEGTFDLLFNHQDLITKAPPEKRDNYLPLFLIADRPEVHVRRRWPGEATKVDQCVDGVIYNEGRSAGRAPQAPAHVGGQEREPLVSWFGACRVRILLDIRIAQARRERRELGFKRCENVHH